MSQNGSDITALNTKVAVVSKVRKRGKYVPREIRIRACNDAHELRRRGLSYDEIRNELHRKYGVWIPVPTIIGWLSGKHDPRNGRRIPSLEMLVRKRGKYVPREIRKHTTMPMSCEDADCPMMK
jgi:intein-encoded DNA endonuclease-like protein